MNNEIENEKDLYSKVLDFFEERKSLIPEFVEFIYKNREKEQARREYTAAKSQGRSASLLEMLKPNIFRMNVANVRPGDSIVIDMRYTEAIYLSENVYEFVYPAVVAPRYVGAVQTEVDAALSGKELPTEIPGKFSISLRLATGVMLKGIYSPSHDLDVDNGNVYTKKNIKMKLKN